MFVIIYQNQVVLGPMKWNKFRFENFLLSEHEITFTLDQSNVNSPVTVNADCKILPIEGTPNPDPVSLLNGQM